jgi:ATP-dependent RNA helicase DeaD
VADGAVRISLSLGKADSFTQKKMARFIETYSAIPEKSIGAVTLFDSFTFFEVPEAHAEKVLASFRGVMHNMRQIHVAISS